MKRSLLLGLVALIALPTFANEVGHRVRLLCEDGVSLEGCAERTEQALQSLNCVVDIENTECSFALMQDPNSSNLDARVESTTPYCNLSSSNCSEAIQGAWSESCDEGTKMVEISRSYGVDRGFGYGIWAEIFGYSRKVCINQ